MSFRQRAKNTLLRCVALRSCYKETRYPTLPTWRYAAPVDSGVTERKVKRRMWALTKTHAAPSWHFVIDKSYRVYGRILSPTFARERSASLRRWATLQNRRAHGCIRQIYILRVILKLINDKVKYIRALRLPIARALEECLGMPEPRAHNIVYACPSQLVYIFPFEIAAELLRDRKKFPLRSSRPKPQFKCAFAVTPAARAPTHGKSRILKNCWEKNKRKIGYTRCKRTVQCSSRYHRQRRINEKTLFISFG